MTTADTRQKKGKKRMLKNNNNSLDPTLVEELRS